MLSIALCLLLFLPDGEEKAPTVLPDEPLSITHHTMDLGKEKLKYTVTTGRLTLKEENGAARAQIFFMAYTRDDVQGAPAQRPLTFSFNGGPGSSSVWLHLGVLGPRRVLMDDQGNALPPPAQLVDNPFGMLDKTDLVFIDPVSTGYSRPADKVDAKNFHGLQEDISSVGEFVRLYLTHNQRWGSPKFLIGESYGTTRAAGLANYLQGNGIYVNGVILVSTILNFMTARFDVGNDLPYLLFLPTYAATAHYHGKVTGDFDRLLRDAEDFAMGPYATALLKGDQLSAGERDQIVTKLCELTGLSREYVLGCDLRINIHNFVKELLRTSHRTVGRLDSRMIGMDRVATDSESEYDPSYIGILGSYTSCFNDYVRRDLGYENDLTYEILTGKVQPWSFGEHENRYVNVSEDLRLAMTQNPSLKVLVASGYYDLATPYFAAQYTIDHMQLDPSIRANISVTHYPAGHMMYIQRESLERLKDDLDHFYKVTLEGPPAP